MRYLVAVSVILVLSACSLYQSPGRKFLEKNAFEFAGVSAQASQLGCQNEPADHASPWVHFTSTTHAEVYSHDMIEFQLRVVPHASGQAREELEFSCDYQFASAQEMFEKTADAVDLTISQSHHE